MWLVVFFWRLDVQRETVPSVIGNSIGRDRTFSKDLDLKKKRKSSRFPFTRLEKRVGDNDARRESGYNINTLSHQFLAFFLFLLLILGMENGRDTEDRDERYIHTQKSNKL